MALTPDYKTQEEVPESLREHYVENKRQDGSSSWRLQVTGEGWSVANNASILSDLDTQKASVAALTGEKEALTTQLTEAQAALEKAKGTPGEREKELEQSVENAKQKIDDLQSRLDTTALDHKLVSAFARRLTPDTASENGQSDDPLALGSFSPLDTLRAKLSDRIRLDRDDKGVESITVLDANGRPATRLASDGINRIPYTLDDLLDAAFKDEGFKKVLPAQVASPANQPPQSGMSREPTITKTDAELVAQIGR